MPAGVPLPWSAQSYHHETDGKNAAPGAVLEAIPRLQSVAPPPPVPEVLDADEPVVAPDEPVVAPDVLVDPAPPIPAPVDPEVVDEEVAPDDFPPPAPAPVDVECAEPQAMLPAMVIKPQTVRSRMTSEPS
jgi:hypothetical protein